MTHSAHHHSTTFQPSLIGSGKLDEPKFKWLVTKLLSTSQLPSSLTTSDMSTTNKKNKQTNPTDSTSTNRQYILSTGTHSLHFFINLVISCDDLSPFPFSLTFGGCDSFTNDPNDWQTNPHPHNLRELQQSYINVFILVTRQRSTRRTTAANQASITCRVYFPFSLSFLPSFFDL